LNVYCVSLYSEICSNWSLNLKFLSPPLRTLLLLGLHFSDCLDEPMWRPPNRASDGHQDHSGDSSSIVGPRETKRASSSGQLQEQCHGHYVVLMPSDARAVCSDALHSSIFNIVCSEHFDFGRWILYFDSHTVTYIFNIWCEQSFFPPMHLVSTPEVVSKGFAVRNRYRSLVNYPNHLYHLFYIPNFLFCSTLFLFLSGALSILHLTSPGDLPIGSGSLSLQSGGDLLYLQIHLFAFIINIEIFFGN
jgi:hypothetical protein